MTNGTIYKRGYIQTSLGLKVRCFHAKNHDNWSRCLAGIVGKADTQKMPNGRDKTRPRFARSVNMNNPFIFVQLSPSPLIPFSHHISTQLALLNCCSDYWEIACEMTEMYLTDHALNASHRIIIVVSPCVVLLPSQTEVKLCFRIL